MRCSTWAMFFISWHLILYLGEKKNIGGEFSVVPTGLLDGAFLTQDYVLGYFQTSLRDLSAVLTQTL
jgi:hypothetical protein